MKKPSTSPSRTPTPPFRLTPRQAEATRLLAGPQRHTLLVGGSRSGKTFALCRAILMRAVRAPGSRHAILRLHANAARSAIGLDTLPKAARLCLPGLALTEHRQAGFSSLANGAEIWVGGLDDKERVEKILGQEFATLYFNECSQIPYASVTMARTRLAQQVRDETGKPLTQRAYYDLNPTGQGHWSYQLFVAGRDPESRQPLADPHQYRHLFLNPRDNAANLSPDYLKELESLPERARRRFLAGEYMTEIDGALWTLDRLEACRCPETALPDLQRVVVAVDPSGGGGEPGGNDAIGICVAGRGVDGVAYVLEDLTCKLAPEGWGRRVVEAWRRHRADAVIAEANYGGDMVRAVFQAVDHRVPVRLVTASRGKAVRAEPVSALYEPAPDGLIRVRHVGAPARFHDLEDELLNFSTAGYQGSRSPNRADALVWALTDLMLGSRRDALIDFYAEAASPHPNHRPS